MEYTSYWQLDKTTDELYASQKYGEAIELLGIARKQFPNYLHEILRYEASIYAIAGDHEKCLTTLEEMIDHEFFRNLEWEAFDLIRDDPRFKAVFEVNQHLRAEAQKTGHMEYQAYSPEGYTPEQKYPLFIALHGDGGSVDYFKSRWEPTVILKAGFVLAYIQSSQVQHTDGYSWTQNYQIARKDIRAGYREVARQYAIDADNILIGGFSGGSIAAIEVVLSNSLPARGFISLCPSLKPDSFTKENVALALQRGARGVILEGELEGQVPAEQEMIAAFQEANFPYQFHINPGIGHDYPKDFPQKLSDAIAFVMD